MPSAWSASDEQADRDLLAGRRDHVELAQDVGRSSSRARAGVRGRAGGWSRRSSPRARRRAGARPSPIWRPGARRSGSAPASPSTCRRTCERSMPWGRRHASLRPQEARHAMPGESDSSQRPVAARRGASTPHGGQPGERRPAPRPRRRARAHRCRGRARRPSRRRGRRSDRRAAPARRRFAWNCSFRLRGGRPAPAWKRSPGARATQLEMRRRRDGDAARFDAVDAKRAAPGGDLDGGPRGSGRPPRLGLAVDADGARDRLRSRPR